jgi:uncharacterized phiE125 gp8 family phage protein
VDQSSEDTLINTLIGAARWHAETYTRRGFINQTWELYLDGFPSSCQAAPSYTAGRAGIIRLEKATVSAVNSIIYVDTNGTPQTLPTNDYQVDLKSSIHPRIAPAYGKSWPSTRAIMNAVTVNFTVGYGASGTAVPEPIKQAMLLLIGGWYQNREAIVPGVSVAELPRPLAVDAILWQHRAVFI